MRERTTKYAKMGTQIVFEEKRHKIIGACLEVYKENGNGFINQSLSRFSRVS
jgi:hypothetical protein